MFQGETKSQPKKELPLTWKLSKFLKRNDHFQCLNGQMSYKSQHKVMLMMLVVLALNRL